MPIPAEYQPSIEALIGMIPLTTWGQIDDDDISLEDPWTNVSEGRNDMYKVKAMSVTDQLFVKRFAPVASEFAQVAATALQELASLNLPVPILSPSFVSEDIHAYKLGIPQPKRKMLEILTLQDLGKIETIVERLKLVSLFGVNFIPQFMKVDTVNIDGQLFIIDPFDDSANSIHNYIRERK